MLQMLSSHVHLSIFLSRRNITIVGDQHLLSSVSLHFQRSRSRKIVIRTIYNNRMRIDHFKDFVLELINREIWKRANVVDYIKSFLLDAFNRSLNGIDYDGSASMAWCDDFLKFLAAVDFSSFSLRDSRLERVLNAWRYSRRRYVTGTSWCHSVSLTEVV
jgi:hypothetical protein